MDPYRSKPGLCPTCGFGLRAFDRLRTAPRRDCAPRLAEPCDRRQVCDGCGGMLITVDDLQSMLVDQGVVELAVIARDATTAACPLCGDALALAELAIGKDRLDARVSTCKTHGLWFDGGALVDALEQIGKLAGQRGSTSVGAAYLAARGAHFNAGTWRGGQYLRPVKRKPAVHTPLATSHADKKLECVKCGAVLARSGAAWVCSDHGAFIEDDALDTLIGEMTGLPWERPAWTGAPGPRACPACKAAMAVEHVHGIEVDRCASDGVWLDPGELEQILARSATTGRKSWIDRLFSRS